MFTIFHAYEFRHEKSDLRSSIQILYGQFEQHIACVSECSVHVEGFLAKAFQKLCVWGCVLLHM